MISLYPFNIKKKPSRIDVVNRAIKNFIDFMLNDMEFDKVYSTIDETTDEILFCVYNGNRHYNFRIGRTYFILKEPKPYQFIQEYGIRAAEALEKENGHD